MNYATKLVGEAKVHMIILANRRKEACAMAKEKEMII